MKAAVAARVALAAGVAAAGVWIGAATLEARSAETTGAASRATARALGLRSRERLERGGTTAAVGLAREALRRDPTVVPAIQTLGLAAQAGGDAARADRLLAHAQRLSRRELQTHLWAIERYVARGDTPAVLREYDLALRASSSAADLLFPVLGGAVEDPAIAAGLVARLRGAPLWREAFLSYMARDARVPPATAVGFLARARAAGVRTPPLDLTVLVQRTVADDPATAWRAYLLRRPGADPRLVRDASFRAISEDASPFDWTVSQDGGIEARSVPDGLEVNAGSGTAGTAAEQLQRLPPGTYRLRIATGPIAEGGSLAAALSCADGTVLTKLDLPNGAPRHSEGPRFTVPARCGVQTLRLSVDASDAPAGVSAEVRRAGLIPAR